MVLDLQRSDVNVPDRMIRISGNTDHPRLRTRVKGLDRLLDGGLLSGDAYLVSGGPGTGKTTLGNQLAFQHAAAGDSAIIFMLQTEPHEWMLAHLGGFAFVRPELINKRIHYVSLLRQLETDGLAGVLQSIQATVRAHDASLIVLDGAGLTESSTVSEAGFGRFVRDLQARASMLNCTAVLLSARSAKPLLAPYVDGVIDLDLELADSLDSHWIRVVKQRGANHLGGRHWYSIDRNGITVYPRLESVAGATRSGWAEAGRRVSTGVAGLDRMLDGGFVGGSTIAVVGTPGAGKTLLNLQFLGAGALEGETGLHVTFHEPASVLAAMCDRLELPCGEEIRRGNPLVYTGSALERSPDGWAWSVLDMVDELRPQRLTIDTFSDVARMFVYLGRQADFGVAFVNELRNRGVTTMMNLEIDAFVPELTSVSMPPISRAIDAGILMRSLEQDSAGRRAMSILKHRQSWFDSTIRTFTIGTGGIAVGDRFDGGRHIVPSDDPFQS